MSDTVNRQGGALASPAREVGVRNTLSLTIVTPAYEEAANLPIFYERLRAVLDGMHARWEWIVVDDHSGDGTPSVLAEIAVTDARVRAFRLSRNFGSHTAITCGLNHAREACAIVMAADLQDPPEEIPALVAEWQRGADIVWAVRGEREGETLSRLVYSHMYYGLMRRMKALRNMPATGADFFLMDRQVIEAFNGFRESHFSVMGLVTWIGFRQARVTYTKQRRLHGRSSWNLATKLKLVADSVTGFTYFPIRLMSYLGFATAAVGLLYAGYVIAVTTSGRPPEGWAVLIVLALILGGAQMMMLGILGEYVWRGLEEARQRPRYIVEALIGNHGEPPSDGHACRQRARP